MLFATRGMVSLSIAQTRIKNILRAASIASASTAANGVLSVNGTQTSEIENLWESWETNGIIVPAHIKLVQEEARDEIEDLIRDQKPEKKAKRRAKTSLTEEEMVDLRVPDRKEVIPSLGRVRTMRNAWKVPGIC